MMPKKDLKIFAEGMIGWLLNSKISSKEGAVYSWINPKKTGYVYPEIMGYYIKILSYLHKIKADEKCISKALATSDYLCNIMNKGYVERDEIRYVFDTAICFSGVMALKKVAELGEKHKPVLEKSIKFISRSLTEKTSAFRDGKKIEDWSRWSLSYGALLIKNSMALIEASEYFDKSEYKELAETMVKDLVSNTFSKGHFFINSKQNFVYTHAHCYATEGLIFLASKGYKDFTPMINSSAQWLSEMQNDDGSMYNWYLKEDSQKDKQGDATSQAIRIWLLTDKKKFRENIDKGTLFLKSLQSEHGGLCYNINSNGEASKDINSWVTMFAVQAIFWQMEKPDAEWIV